MDSETLEQITRERYLKERVFETIVEEEWLNFAAQTQTSKELREPCLFSCVLDVFCRSPFIAKHGIETINGFRDFVEFLPTFHNAILGGTKKDLARTLQRVIASFLILLSSHDRLLEIQENQYFNTLGHWVAETGIAADEGFESLSSLSLESENQRRESSESNENRKTDETNLNLEQKIEILKSKVDIIANLISQDLETFGVEKLFSIFSSAKTIKDLPTSYYEFFLLVSLICSSKLYSTIQEPAAFEKIKLTSSMLPQFVIVQIFKFTNPLKLANQIVNLLLVKFGSIFHYVLCVLYFH